MSAERVVPPAPAAHPLRVLALAGAAILTIAAAVLVWWLPRTVPAWDVLAADAPGGRHIAIVRGTLCDGQPCESLWIGSSHDTAVRVGTLAPGIERCDEIAWTPDGVRVGFLVNGYQLRMFEAATLVPAGQFSLVEIDGHPTSRLARGVTFSENGRAVTYDDCPRARSGCRAGLRAVPVGR